MGDNERTIPTIYKYKPEEGFPGDINSVSLFDVEPFFLGHALYIQINFTAARHADPDRYVPVMMPWGNWVQAVRDWCTNAAVEREANPVYMGVPDEDAFGRGFAKGFVLGQEAVSGTHPTPVVAEMAYQATEAHEALVGIARANPPAQGDRLTLALIGTIVVALKAAGSTYDEEG